MSSFSLLEQPSVIDDIRQLVGHTPLLELKTLFPDAPARIFAKLEYRNPMSNKDRPVLTMVEEAMKAGLVTKDTEVVEASSGNTAISLAILSTRLGFKVRIFMHAGCSMERRQILRAFGATVMITPQEEQTEGARMRAQRYCDEHRDSAFFLNQHDNPHNAQSHIETTGPEIWAQTGGKIDAIVIGLGTSGTWEGLATYFKGMNPDIQVIAFEPAGSPVYSGKPKGKHHIVGIGPGFITPNYKRSAVKPDEIVLVGDEESYEVTRQIAMKEGILVGITSGAGAWVANHLAQRESYRGKTIVCIFCDSGERYLSTPGLFPTDCEFVA